MRKYLYFTRDKIEIMQKQRVNTAKTLVLKFGTSVLTQGSLKLHRPQILEIVRQCAILHQEGYRIV